MKLIEEKSEDLSFDVAALFERAVGVRLSDFLSALVLKVNATWENGFEVTIALGDGAEREYLVTGLSARLVEAAERAPLLADRIAAAGSLAEIAEFAFSLFTRSFAQ